MLAASPSHPFASPNEGRALAALARARIANTWQRFIGCLVSALTATAMLGNAWALYWFAGLVLVLAGDRAVYRWLLARCEAGIAPRQRWPLVVWTVLQSTYGNILAALLWFSPYVPGETLAVIYICGGIANAAATLRSSAALSLAGAGPTIVFLLGLPLIAYGLSGWTNPMLLMPFVAGLLLVGFGASLWRSLLESDAAQARAEASAMRERQSAAAAAAAKSDTIRRMNDELRTPMQALIGAAEHLRRAAVTPEARAHIATLAQAGEVLKLVLDDLSDLDRLENGVLRIDPKPSDPREIARGVVSAFRAAAQDKHLELFLDVARDTPACVEIDALRVRQILFNLVANAVRFTTHGGVRVSLNARASETDGVARLHFVVADTGAGMSRAQLAQIFGRERLSGEGEGPGLGLAISLRLARLMGGHVNAKSDVGEGSVFTLSLEAPVIAAARASSAA
jgi:signal transduction histidine kinase